jgi:hypothetical protein
MIEFEEYGIKLSSEQIKAAIRFNACVEDGQEYDVSPELMWQLAELCLVADKGDGYFEQTDLMMSIKESIAKSAQTIFENTNGAPFPFYCSDNPMIGDVNPKDVEVGRSAMFVDGKGDSDINNGLHFWGSGATAYGEWFKKLRASEKPPRGKCSKFFAGHENMRVSKYF